jgi:hypothetical protein
LLDGAAGGAGPDGGELSVVSGGGLFFAGGFDDGVSSGTLADTVEAARSAAGNAETGVMGHSAADVVLIPLFKGILAIINLAKGFSPIDSLSSGRSITWTELGAAFGQIVLLLGGITGIIGIVLFSRRELATAQGNQ